MLENDHDKETEHLSLFYYLISYYPNMYYKIVYLLIASVTSSEKSLVIRFRGPFSQNDQFKNMFLLNYGMFYVFETLNDKLNVN